MLGLVGSIAGSCTEKFVGVAGSCHVCPLSVDRHRPMFGPLGVSQVGIVPPEKTPIVVAAQIVVLVVDPAVDGSMRIFEIALPTNGPGLPNGLPPPPTSVHRLPPSAERRMPCP